VTGEAIYSGRIRHHRASGPSHSFGYRVWYALIDLDTIPKLTAGVPFLSHNSFNLLSFDDRDHMGFHRRPVKEKLAEWFHEQRDPTSLGRVLLLTQLRVLGHVFNPVSFYFCHDRAGDLQRVVAEVNNTFGESYCYSLEAEPGRGVVDAEKDKVFHVSPFQTNDGRYRFRVGRPEKHLTIRIDTTRHNRRAFSAELEIHRRPFTARSLAATLARHPHTGLMTLAYIHTQALRLWLKGAPFIPKPEPPAKSWRTRNAQESVIGRPVESDRRPALDSARTDR
jgi:DUF1365 family protein